ncbi:hypothetical protein GGI04_002673 [Coemansia thaxteri]|uniref:Phosphoribulokinase/uridine kinase domain-containing protein n=1 Tax=Coemansia thaxteri TaxID=2663907 RepID=A0A9W8EI60_9FUNG|nr:hypothetical protein H4R26_002788 [Coemansia thaxteri]KAJ2004237.1 hypothetical protein GGI04_002673 [Coemansia thaxteri]KAJ2470773.1 hypothetical protein GGI02_002707 [Coemansia sp. RSA 2322]KAJ2474731.1 hypothetical protein EV174_005530 [Coemansia sp. RSA 2320]
MSSSAVIAELAAHLVGLLEEAAASEQQHRIVVAVAGTPGSGKTHVSRLVSQAVNAQLGRDACAVVPMDGFHLTRAQLQLLPDPIEALRRRGAPWTFDAEAFVAAVRQLRHGAHTALPGFDHAAGDPVAGAVAVGPAQRIVLVEGLYAHVAELPWALVGTQLADELWWMQPADAAAAHDRLVLRHVASGLAADRQAAEARISGNDAPNAAYVMQSRLPATRVIMN